MIDDFGSFTVSNLKPIRDMIYESLRQAIFDGELKTGERLVEKELAQRMNVSRTPIREALRKLETEGLVKHLPRKGVVVKGFAQEDVMEIYSIRQALEALAIKYTVKNITEKEIEQLTDLIDIMEILTQKNDDETLFNTSQKFNNLLVKSCKMPRLINLISTYHEYLERFRITTMEKRERKLAAFREHKAILQAVIEGDAEKAEELVKVHLQGAREAYLSTFVQEDKTEDNEEDI